MDIARSLLATAVNQPVENVSDDAAISAQEGWDSLAHIRLIAGIEKHLGREMTTEEVVTINSLASIAKVVGD